MKLEILESLKKLEKEKGIKILYAAESGSRAWGFPSPDSDYDVRIIYKYDLDWYLSLTDKKDAISFFATDLIDIVGWEFRKVLKLAAKSNMSPFEWIQSPIIYRTEDGFQEELKNIINPLFSPIASLHHYLSMAKNFYYQCNDEKSLKLKTWFYGLRTSMNALWILENQTVPPIVFVDSFELISDRPDLVKKIHSLIERKATMDEKELFEGDDELLAFMKEIITKCEEEGNNLKGIKKDMKPVNDFFIRKIKE